ncbi:beta-lactamase family protein [Bacillus sp. DNRA2]|uniref:serine hydrolase domain-containing protein n=1 Tax=Bacillus sp. DNRA2 TaxID=2723053 RepID=UPI00145CCECC|nr:serine hydrolase domain-containing protein [Bacillus sp. DNRA2]NMD72081.1 beta-lactamase family protein [Bacillus sp. DNRA2]
MNNEVKGAERNSNDKIEAIDTFIQNKLDKNHIPGAAVAITYNNEVIFTKGYGKSENGAPITDHTGFPIASLSKAFTALAVMQLVEEDKVNLDQPIATYLPSLISKDKKWSKVTPRHLLNHTSGLTDKAYPDMTVDPQPKSLEDMVRKLKNVSLTSEPGTEYHYNNTNYQLLALLVERVSNEEFSSYLNHHIFVPLEMKDTFNVSNTKQFNKSNKLTEGHYFLFGQLIAKDEPEWFINGPAGMVSTAKDMANWLILQENEGTYKGHELLSSKGIQEMQTPTGTKISYGMGWNTFKDYNENRLQHSGILWTYKSEALILPESGYGIVILFNSGLNAFVDYYSFIDGIANILTNQDVNEPFYNNQLFEGIVGFIIVLSIILGVRQLLRVNRWAEKFKKGPKWRFALNFSLRLIPLFLLIFLPKIMTFIGGGRVLSWEGILLMIPSVCVLLVVVSLVNLLIVIFRVKRIFE